MILVAPARTCANAPAESPESRRPQKAAAAPRAQTRTGLINGSQSRLSGPQGLKPSFFLAGSGTAEAVPFPKPFMRPVLFCTNRDPRLIRCPRHRLAIEQQTSPRVHRQATCAVAHHSLDRLLAYHRHIKPQ